MTDIEMKSFDEGNDIHLKATYTEPGTTTPKAPDADPQVDIQKDGTSLSGFPATMTQISTNVFEYWWDASGEDADIYVVKFLSVFGGHDHVGVLKVQLK